MKKIIIIILLVTLNGIAFAQFSYPLIQSRNKKNTSNRKLPDSLLPKILTPAPLPDLSFYNLRVKYDDNVVIGGQIRQYLKVEYSIKNSGLVPILLRSVSVQGYLSGITPVTVAKSACGTVVSEIVGKNLAPGEVHSGLILCTASLNKSNRYLYTLLIDSHNSINESNEQNNSSSVEITY